MLKNECDCRKLLMPNLSLDNFAFLKTYLHLDDHIAMHHTAQKR